MNRCYSVWLLSLFVFVHILLNIIQKKHSANWAVGPTIRFGRTQYFVIGERQVVIKYSVSVAIFNFYFFCDWPDDENIGFEILATILYWTWIHLSPVSLWTVFLDFTAQPHHVELSLMASSCVCWQTLYWNKSDMFGPL